MIHNVLIRNFGRHSYLLCSLRISFLFLYGVCSMRCYLASLWLGGRTELVGDILASPEPRQLVVIFSLSAIVVMFCKIDD